MDDKKILFKEECYQINSCIYAVNKKLGCGFLEAVYQEALEIEILYDGIPLTKRYIADIVCYDKIIIEIKAVLKTNDYHKAQLINYLAATGYKVGLLVNFSSSPKAEIIRLVR